MFWAIAGLQPPPTQTIAVARLCKVLQLSVLGVTLFAESAGNKRRRFAPWHGFPD